MPVLENTSEDTRIYEFCVLYPYGISQKEEQEIIKAVEGHFNEAEGKQIAKDNWGRRGLSYPIKGHSEGNFVIYYYELDPAKISDLDEAIRITPGVLRHIVVKPPKGYEIVNYSEKFAEWKKEEAEAEERKKQKKEEALKRRVAEKAKRQAKRTEEKMKEETSDTPEKKRDITDELEKLISDDDLDI